LKGVQLEETRVQVCTVACQTINADRVIDTQEQGVFIEKTPEKFIL